ncbi:CHAD domain-containing protein [Microvirga aerophila]|uniref:CHAD domain-containing protein n=1 Tax=Microvirga aerophila TaxID=670291 RepID=A0A512BPR5_9HYPH|nr:CHAD domain-containing protein [Microvirga aerophila]GEO13817.1 hypothetical protein MAE02_15130 [Microvirga aerophila]
MAFDDGINVVANQRVPLTEIELVLKSGDEPALYDLAISLADELALRLDFVSKAEHGFQAMSRATSAAVKATPIQFASGATLDAAVQAVLSNTLLHFVANWAAIREAENPSTIHHMRVALCRMRAALATFKRALRCSDFDLLREEAKRIASALGPARDCDVFCETADNRPLAHPDRPVDCNTLLAAIEKRPNAAYTDARSRLEDRDTTLFV